MTKNKCRFFDSAEVRVAQDDSAVSYRNFGDWTLAAFPVHESCCISGLHRLPQCDRFSGNTLLPDLRAAEQLEENRNALDPHYRKLRHSSVCWSHGAIRRRADCRCEAHN